MTGAGKVLLAVALAATLSATPASPQSVKAGIDAWARGDYGAALGQWRPLAARNNPDALFNLGQAYRLGRGTPIDLARAEDWYTRAARLGHVDAQTQLGIMLFQNGYPFAAAAWLRRSADKGDARAQLLYGTALYNGDGVPKRDALAGYAYVAKSAAQGLSPAKSALADMDRDIPEHLRRLATTAGRKPPLAPALSPPSPPLQPSASASPQRTALAVPVAKDGGWRVQLGAFSRRDAAESLFRKLSAGPLAGRQPFFIAAGAVTRLQAGPYGSREEAIRACAQLTARGQPCFAVPAR